jgi:hypothetical protein
MMTTSHSERHTARVPDLSGVPVSLYPSVAEYPRHDAPDMLYALDGTGTKTCRVCDRAFHARSEGYHAHAAMHIRAGLAAVVVTLRYRRWYQLTGAGRIHYATRAD